MKRIFRRMAAWVVAVLTTIFIGVILQTQNVIARLNDIGADISVTDRLSMTAYDVIHLGSLYGAFIAIAFLIAFLAGGLVFRFVRFGRPFIYGVAGGIAMLIMMLAMKQVFFDTHLIAGARDTFGIALQMMAGAIGGFVFAKLSLNLRYIDAEPPI